MPSIHQEYDSAIELVISEYQNLQKLNPSHKLLKLLKNVDSKGFTKTREFVRRYGSKYSREGIHYEIQTLSTGYLEFKKAVTAELFEILRQEKKNPKKDLEERLEKRELIGMVRTHITHNQISLEKVLDLISS